MQTHINKLQEDQYQALPKPQPYAALTSTLVDNRPTATAQGKLLKDINNSPKLAPLKALQAQANTATQLKANQTGMPSQLKTGIENLSGLAMDDVRVHYNSAKPAQLQAHAYAQGAEIHIAPGQEKHLPHEAWHVVQQKQGRVKPTLQLKGINLNNDASLEREADIMGASALQQAANRTQISLKETTLLKSVFQRQLIVGDKSLDKHAILDGVISETRGRIHGWLTNTDGMKATMNRNKDLKMEATATESAIKGHNYLDLHLPQYMSTLLNRYDTENRVFANKDEFERQVVQDVKLSILRLDQIVGIDHHDGQFSQSDRSGGGKPLRIYRTTTREDWNNYLHKNNIVELLHGHGGSLGQALDYFYKSKTSNEDGPWYDNVIFEILLNRTADNAIDYNGIISGGEGVGPAGGKLTGKREQNDLLGENHVFSVNLTASRELLMSMNPRIKRVDEMKGEDSEYSKRLLKFAIKYGKYPPDLSEDEKAQLDRLRPH